MPEMDMAGAIRAILKGEAEPVVRDGVLVGLVMDIEEPHGRRIEPEEREGAQEQCAPSKSQWVVTVIYGRLPPVGGDTDYDNGYYWDEPGDAEIASLVPDGYELLESKILRTAGHPDGAQTEESE
jgi:hypothetical protein